MLFGNFPQQNRKLKMRGKDDDVTELSVETIFTAGLGTQANETRGRKSQNREYLPYFSKGCGKISTLPEVVPSTEDAETSHCVLHHLFFPGPVSLLFRKPLRGLSVSLHLQLMSCT